MVHREGVGAAIAAVALFSVLLFSNLLILSAAQERERLSLQSNEESLLYDTGRIVAGSEGLYLLGRAQTILSAQIFNCSNATPTIRAQIDALSTSQKSAGLEVSERLALADDLSSPDNMTILKPYNGSLRGELDLALMVEESTRSAIFGVSYLKAETHFLHLPAHLASMVSLCLRSVQMIEESVRNPDQSCDARMLESTASGAVAGISDEIRSQGLNFSLSFFAHGAGGCPTEIRYLISQVGVLGPGGLFTVTMMGRVQFPP